MGGPKALLLWEGGEPLVAAHARAAAAHCATVLVVTRAAISDRLSGACGAARVIVSTFPDPMGSAGSIRAAARSGLLDGREQVLIVPVDTPVPLRATVCALFSALDAGARAARACVGPARGHPVACEAAVILEHYGQDVQSVRPLRDVLDTLGGECADVALEGDEILLDFNTPEELRAATGRDVCFWRWPAADRLG
jgi:CTP:molybdopterin cytidylyltransferase MocA